MLPLLCCCFLPTLPVLPHTQGLTFPLLENADSYIVHGFGECCWVTNRLQLHTCLCWHQFYALCVTHLLAHSLTHLTLSVSPNSHFQPTTTT